MGFGSCPQRDPIATPDDEHSQRPPTMSKHCGEEPRSHLSPVLRAARCAVRRRSAPFADASSSRVLVRTLRRDSLRPRVSRTGNSCILAGSLEVFEAETTRSRSPRPTSSDVARPGEHPQPQGMSPAAPTRAAPHNLTQPKGEAPGLGASPLAELTAPETRSATSDRQLGEGEVSGIDPGHLSVHQDVFAAKGQGAVLMDP